MSDASGDYYGDNNATDVVAVFDTNYNQLFSDARPLKAKVVETAKTMNHPLESGAQTTDFRVFQPIKIDLSMVLNPENYIDTYNQIKSIFVGNGTIIVQTLTGFYPNMVIDGLPHEEDPKHIDTIFMSLSLHQIIIAQKGSSMPASATTQNGGAKPAVAASKTQTAKAESKASESTAASQNSTLYNLFH